MAYLITFDLTNQADYHKARKLLEARGFRREWNRIPLPETTWFYPQGMNNAIKTCREWFDEAGLPLARLAIVQAETVACWDAVTSTEYRVI